jgi:hypothetical protein
MGPLKKLFNGLIKAQWCSGQILSDPSGIVPGYSYGLAEELNLTSIETYVREYDIFPGNCQWVFLNSP